MPDAKDNPALEWRNGSVPVSTRFDDPYFSMENGLDETRHVFLDGNDLPGRFRDGFHIAELGFGTGLNLLAAQAAFKKCGLSGRLRFTSFEAFPLSHAEVAKALSVFPEVDPSQLLSMLAAGETRLETEHLTFELILGDARETLPIWTGTADAWFLDGFSPAKNPELWDPDLMAAVARHTRPAGTFATYTAAGDVRRALSAAGFSVTRRPGYGRKRHMSTGVLA